MSAKNNVQLIETPLDVTPDAILEVSKGKITGSAMVIGWDKDDNLYYALTTTSTAENLLLLERAKESLLRQ